MPEDMPEELEYSVKASWIGFDEAQVSTANQFVSQFDGDVFYLSFGLITPPLLIGTLEERREQLEQLDYLPVRTLARISVAPSRMRRLIEILTENLGKYEARHGQKEDEA